MKKAMWLASYPKSGNTWVRLFMSAYVWDRPVESINDAHPMVAHSCDYPPAYHMVSSVPLAKMSGNEIMLLRPAAIYNILRISTSTHPMIKTHCANVLSMGVATHPPLLTRGAILLVRDPRDVCVSYAAYQGKLQEDMMKEMLDDNLIIGGDIREGVKTPVSSWSKFNDTWSKTVAGESLVVRYEDLLSDPEREFSRIVEHVGFPIEKDRMHRAIYATEFKALEKLEEKQTFTGKMEATEKFFRRGKSNAWKSELDPKIAKKIQHKFAKEMEHFGYES